MGWLIVGVVLSTTITKTGDYGLGPIPTHPAPGRGLRPVSTPPAQSHPAHPAHSVPQTPMGTDGHVSAGLPEESEYHSATSAPPLCVHCVVCGGRVCLTFQLLRNLTLKRVTLNERF
jgi:hypothetical protein